MLWKGKCIYGLSNLGQEKKGEDMGKILKYATAARKEGIIFSLQFPLRKRHTEFKIQENFALDIWETTLS